ncbi:HD domain protein [Thermosipho africanus TCF52B]|uniref:HD domain protein n=1 Tax=Thermosipho africanus (strain TCF52B) TaxID=484019 RepID=B7IDR3_THEAB|nr:HD domain-containing phosphohydrolase [Thermosipho africanus]ACJ76140.1 HD domain protein [Thermosipho africanus TCF52B]
MTINHFIKRKIRNHIILPIVIIGVIAGIIMTLLGIRAMFFQLDLQLSKSVREWNDLALHVGNFLNVLSQDKSLFEDKKNLENILKIFYENYKNMIEHVYFSVPEKNLVFIPEAKIPENLLPKDRPWFKKSLEKKDFFQVSPPYIDAVTGEIVLTISKYVEMRNGYGVLGVDINPNYIVTHILDRNVILIDQDNTVIYSNNKKIIGRKLKIDHDKKYRIYNFNVLLFQKALGDIYIVVYENYVIRLLPNFLITITIVLGILVLGHLTDNNVEEELNSNIRVPIENIIDETKRYLTNQEFDGSKINTEIEEIDVLVNEIADMISIIEANFQELKATNEELEEAYKEIEKYSGELETTYELFIEKMATIVEGFDEDTGNHIKRVQVLSKFLAEKMKLPDNLVKKIYLYSALHDIGKIKVPPEILRKPSSLSNEEWEIMKKHTIWGAEILDGDERLEIAKRIALYHHEKFNGRGYPYGLKGEQIPIEAQIVNIVDVYDALRSKRPYKKPFTHKKALEIMLNGDGRTSPDEFNPKILEIFKTYEAEIENIWENLSN